MKGPKIMKAADIIRMARTNRPSSPVIRCTPTGGTLDRWRVGKDECPSCLSGELDTGWECTFCGYDAKWIADRIAAPPTPPKTPEGNGQ